MGSLTTLGGASKTTFLASEEYKITVELEANEAIKKGQPIKLTADGKAAVWAKADGKDLLIGYAYGDCAVGELTTIWSRGFAMIYAVSKAAQNAGPATYDSYNAATDVGGTKGYNVYSLSVIGTDEVNGWSLDVATAANQLIRVLLMD